MSNGLSGETLASRVERSISEVIVGQRAMIEGLLIGLLTGGHVLLEGVPGLAKTLTIASLSRALDVSFRRIQFTPDLLPADLIGTMIYNPREGTFAPRKGPIFANLILADEINRAPAKVQSALLEAMQEKQVTIGDSTYRLEEPFLVLATQNPVDQEGTYQLPEAQVDRFMLKLVVTYPTRDEERGVIDRMATSGAAASIEPVASGGDILRARREVDEVYVDGKVKDYVLDLVSATRHPESIDAKLGGMVRYGASPRASIALVRAAKARAYLRGRNYVDPGDVKAVAPDVLRHRVIVTYEALAEEIGPEQVVSRVLSGVHMP
ncbi:MAG: AAA family ATPase [Phycisphaerales bacterium]|jgi:MoxR-like ATPase|nr:AAA family ATPase [Phycisphaerales bacterium]